MVGNPWETVLLPPVVGRRPLAGSYEWPAISTTVELTRSRAP
ncbi:hypothetical protein D187_008056 [Cystobacter fuscus DSM 2262]|uniref:Uncharacterized protein n=1 Tax=Cystobacter fuscus (strain ATCC 25194 / DSM 2262 / NBRC 100088 / M29) TaxID=1242864 RepID=S9Q5X4_CYSF2|nr:hypothetical protein D187_008056 [Cystobacter fuscus DSM 2262]